MAEEIKNDTQTQDNNEYMRCPCCGEMTLHKPLEVKSIVLDEYMSSIITGVPFSHTYTLHDSIDVTVEVPLKKDALMLQRALKQLEKLRTAAKSQEESDKLRAAWSMIQVYGNIVSIVTRKDNATVNTYFPSECIKQFVSAIKDMDGNIDLIIEAYESCDTTENMSTIPEIMLNAIVKTHGDVYRVLMDTGFNETFWKGIELV